MTPPRTPQVPASAANTPSDDLAPETPSEKDAAGLSPDEAEEAELASDELVNSGRDRKPGPVEK